MRLKVEYSKTKMDVLVKGLQGAPAQIQLGLKEAMFASVLQVHRTAVQPGYAPFQTGTLRRSITFTVEESQGRVWGAVGSNLVYAAIHEFGGRTGRNQSVQIQPKRYLGRAVEENRDFIRDRFRKLKVLKKT